MVMEGTSPVTYRIALAKELIALRVGAKLQHEDVARELAWTPSKVSKIESGTATVRADEIDRLLELFAAGVEDVERIKVLAENARKRGSFGRVADWARQYLGLERDATALTMNHTELIHGLMQTPEYAKAVISTSATVPAVDVQRAVESRMRRKTILDRDDPPVIQMVLGEGALHRRVGGAHVLAEQLRYLADLARRPNITIRYLPFKAGAHPALGCNFTLLDVPIGEETRTWAYSEDLTRADLLDGEQHVGAYRLVWRSLLDRVATPRETIRAFESVATDLEKK